MEALVAALPAELQPPAEAPASAGPLRGAIRVTGARAVPLAWGVAGKLELADLRARARETTPSFLWQSFTHRALAVDGTEIELVVGPENPDFVPLAELPSWVTSAVLTSEDGGFVYHSGFDFAELKDSILAVAETGRAIRGGSTLTQQLAKNLFLSREKTYARKVREALVTVGLESGLSKERLLEIYLNIIEWGPGIYGIEPAARAYFGKGARELTPRQAVYLASIIPSPVRHYTHRERSQTPEWALQLDTVLRTMAERGQLSPESYAEAVASAVTFSTLPVQ
jgi:membrane peptidoglycan carboxypeptidase